MLATETHHELFALPTEIAEARAVDTCGLTDPTNPAAQKGDPRHDPDIAGSPSAAIETGS
jgi:hypothetical protein